MRIGIALIPCLLAAIAFGDEKKPEAITLTGKVVAADGKPVAGATVEFRSDAVGREKVTADIADLDDLLAGTTANEKGEFTLSKVALPALPGSQRWTAGPVGYLLARAKGHGLGWHTVQLPANQPIDLKMPEPATVRGRVVDEAGKPVASAKVNVTNITLLGVPQGWNSHHSFWRTKVPVSTVSDADGRFEVNDVPKEARLDLVFLHDQFVRTVAYAATTDKPQPPAAVTYTNTSNGSFLTRRVPVHLHDFTVALQVGRTVTGRVVFEDTGKPAAGMMVMLQGNESGYSRTATDAEGRFTCRQLPRGKGSYTVSPPEITEYIAANGSFEIPADKDEATLEPIKLPRGAIISGKVVDEDTGKGIAGVNLYFQVQTPSRDWQGSSARTEDDGKFRMSVPPGTGTLMISGQVEGYVAGLGFARSPQNENPFAKSITAKLDTPVTDVTFKLGKGLTVSGRALDTEGKPVAGAKVMLMNEFGGFRAQQGMKYFTPFTPFSDRTIKTDQEGKFTLDFLVPGMESYANASMEGFTQANSPQAKLAVGERKDIGDLTLGRADQSVGGVVVDPAGRPIAGVQVYAYSNRNGNFVSSSEQIVTDQNGRFKVTKLPRGPVDITVQYERDQPGAWTSARVRSETGRDDVRVVIFGRKSAPAEAVVGKPAPEFPVASWHNGKTASDQKSFTRAAFQGKVVLLAFIDEAKPSQRVLPQLQTLQEKLREQGLVVLRVYEGSNIDELVKLSPLAAVIVPGGAVPGYAEAMAKYGVRATPTLFLIDKQGVLRQVDAKPEEVESKIKELLKE
jgi:protocatechuate 3,4-dioxygenase beta subunit